MSEPVSDDSFARHLQQIGLATHEQIEAARARVAEVPPGGSKISLAEALISQNVITAEQKVLIEKALRAQQDGPKELGGYTLIRKLGEGGMGTVFLAENKARQKFAIKVLAQRLGTDSDFLRRFQREARAAANLKHENVISAVDVGEHLNTHYYVMEYCEGEPLDAILKRGTALTVPQALNVVIQVARGLLHAHDNRIIHRDIKPANIFIAAPAEETTRKLGELGTARILDLGLSKCIGDSEQSFTTQTGVIMGTPHYISPEQANGDKRIDGRTDIYSLGATFYHLVTGETPFQADTPSLVIMKHMSHQLPNPQDLRPGIPDGLSLVLQKMMAKLPQDRYANCSDLIVDLELVARGEAPLATIDDKRSSIMTRKLPTGGMPTRPGFRHATQPGMPAVEESSTLSSATQPASSTRIVVLSAATALIVVIVVLFASRNGTTPSTSNETPKPEPQVPAKRASEKVPAAEPVAEKRDLAQAIALNLGGGTKLEMVLVNPGEFEMGSDGFGGSAPAHRVRITKPYYIGKYEVTVAQFQVFVAAKNYKTEAEKMQWSTGVRNGAWENRIEGINWRKPGFPQDEAHPVCHISWNDAVEYCKWASQTSGRTVRLPTEAEWEFAARGPDSLIYPWGDTWDSKKFNCADKTLTDTGFKAIFGSVQTSDGFAYTAPVGSFPLGKSWCGIFDASGNLWEWCRDGFADYHTSQMLIDPEGPKQAANYVIRGGCWNANYGECNGLRRLGRPSSDRAAGCGFRVAVDAR